MFAHAISNTRATTASNASSGRSNRSRSGEAPLPAKSSLNGCFRNVSLFPAALGMDPARMAGCTARMAAVASWSDCPRFNRSMTRSHGPSSGYGVDDMITRWGSDRHGNVERLTDDHAEECRWRDADHGHRHAIEQDFGPDDLGGACVL